MMMKSDNNLIPLVDALYIPLAFYIISTAGKMSSWFQVVLLILLFLLAQSEYSFTRESYKNYTIPIYISDLFTLFLYIFSLSKLQKETKHWLMYNHDFWFIFSFLWLMYAIWNFLMFSYSTIESQKNELFKWSIRMILFFVISTICSLLLSYLLDNEEKFIEIMTNDYYMVSIMVIHFLLVSLIISTLLMWLFGLSEILKNNHPQKENI